MSTIGSNIGALRASNYLTQNTSLYNKSTSRLASGNRFGGDASSDPAGVAVSANLQAALERLNASSEGAQNVISLGQVTDSSLSIVQSQLTRMSELAQRATNGAFSAEERSLYQTEFNALRDQVEQFSQTASFNGVDIFQDQTIQTAVNANGDTDSFELKAMDTASLGIDGLDISTVEGARNAIDSINTALGDVTQRRAEVNADISKFNFHIQNTRTESVNVAAAQGRVSDLDMAEESTLRAKYDIMRQSSTMMLVQANASQRSALRLLQPL